MSGEARIQAAALVIRAAWEAGHASAGDLAAALDACHLLQSPAAGPDRPQPQGGTPDER